MLGRIEGYFLRFEIFHSGFFLVGIFSIHMMDKLFCVVTFNPLWKILSLRNSAWDFFFFFFWGGGWGVNFWSRDAF